MSQNFTVFLGDLLSVTCDEELAEAFRLADAQGILRLELSLVPARTRTVIFDNKPLLVSGAAPSTYDERFDPPPKTRPEEVEIKIQIQPETKSVKSVVIERTPSGKSEIALPVAPRPNSVAFLSASTAVSVKDFSDQVMKNVDIQHVRARDASALASAEVLLVRLFFPSSRGFRLIALGDQRELRRYSPCCWRTVRPIPSHCCPC